MTLLYQAVAGAVARAARPLLLSVAAWMPPACPQALDPPLPVIVLTGWDVIPLKGRSPRVTAPASCPQC